MECISSASQSCGGAGPAAQLFAHLLSSLLTAQCSLLPFYPPDVSDSFAPSYDFIVVGAGSAGSAVAAGLAANPDWNVLLIEAGGDPDLNSDIPAMMWSIEGAERTWEYQTVPQENSCGAMVGRQCAWSRGKMLGGSSGTNVMIYQIGTARDYDRWDEMGLEGWGWQDVKRYFEAQLPEVHHEYPLHGAMRGRMMSAAQEIGVGVITDPELRSMGYVGYRRSLTTTVNGTRNNAARIFLVPIANSTNLHVIKHSLVGKILLDDNSRQVEGVEVFIGGKRTKITARREVILSAGAINTPQLLMLSGIGPKYHLQSLGIPVVVDLPVGEHLQDHPSLVIAHKVNPVIDEAEADDQVYEFLRHRSGPLTAVGVMDILGFVNTTSLTSSYPDLEFHHMYHTSKDIAAISNQMINMRGDILNDIAVQIGEDDIFLMYLALLHPESFGRIRLNSTDPFDKPLIDPQYNTADADIRTFIRGVQVAHKFMQSNAMRAAKPEFMRPNLPDCDQLEFNTEAYWRCYIRYFTTTIWHPVGTAQMGTVVDARLRVRGIGGLRVADASVMPTTITGNTNGASMMIGQKAADLIQEDWSSSEIWGSPHYITYP